MNQDNDICKKCAIRGKCCYLSIIIEGYNIHLPNHPCRFLDLDKRECTVYDDRFAHNKYCVTMEQGKQRGYLPKDCPHLKDCSERQLRMAVVDYDDVKDELSEMGRTQYDLTNNSTHENLVGRMYDEASV